MPTTKKSPSKSKPTTSKKAKVVEETVEMTTETAETPVTTASKVEAAETVETAETAATPLVEDDQSAEFTNQFNELSTIVNTLLSSLKDVQSQMKNLQKIHNKEVKTLQKKTKKKRTSRDGKSKNPSGFTQPTKITDELAVFLNVEKGSMLPRTEVTKQVNVYIKEHGLQWEQNKRHIKPDKKLGKLLNVGKDQDLTYFNLQTYLKPHYIKEVKA
jgi:chromatin remodeling complex protein RSC6